MAEARNIEVSMETYNTLHSIQTSLEKILHKKVSFDLLLKVLFTVNHADEIICELSELLREKSMDKEVCKG
jgi:hypothetical protein